VWRAAAARTRFGPAIGRVPLDVASLRVCEFNYIRGFGGEVGYDTQGVARRREQRACARVIAPHDRRALQRGRIGPIPRFNCGYDLAIFVILVLSMPYAAYQH